MDYFQNNFERYIKENENENANEQSFHIKELKKHLDKKKQILDLKDLGLYKLPNMAEEFNYISTLDVSDNVLEEIVGLKKLENLKFLYIQNNHIESIELGSEKLLKVDCSSNKIKKLPSLKKLTKLTSLNCSRNELDTLPNLMSNMELVNLIAGHNNISKLPKLTNLTNLVELDLSYNELEKVDGLNNLHNAKSIKLNSNGISKISDFSKLKHLKEIYLDHNSLTTCESFIHVNKDVKIYLKNNYIPKLELEWFNNNRGNIKDYWYDFYKYMYRNHKGEIDSFKWPNGFLNIIKKRYEKS